MKKLKGSILAKLVAWILISVTGVIMVASFAFGCYFVDRNVYQQDYAERETKNMIAEVSRQYANKVMQDRDEGTNLSYFKNTNFRYGLLKADDISKVDFMHAEFLESNLPQYLKKEDLQIIDMPVNSYSSFYFLDDGLFGASDYTIYIPDDSKWQSWYVNRIGFDTTHGIFYYHTEERDVYYPIKNVSLTFRDNTYSYQYVQDKNTYVLALTSRNPGYSDYEGDAEDGLYLTSEEAAQIKQLLCDEASMDFAKLDKTKFNHEHWTQLVFDQKRYLNTEEEPLSIVNMTSATNVVSAKDEYYLDDNFTLRTKTDEDIETENYYVVVLPPDNIKANLKGDLYERRMFLLHFSQNYKVTVWVVFAISLVLTLGLFVFLMCAAGYGTDKSTKELCLKDSFILKIPLEIEGVIYIMLSGFILAIVASFTYVSFFILLFGLLLAWISIAFCINFAIRVKHGKWWQHTITYLLWNKVKTVLKSFWKIIKNLFYHREIIWKFWILFAAYKCAEGILVIFLGINLEGFFLLTLVEAFSFGIFASLCSIQLQKLKEAGECIANGDYEKKVDTSKMYSSFKEHGENLNHIGAGITKAVNEKMKSEHFKTELITNVSHDIKTPLTSIINYVDLLEKEDLQNEKAVEYLEILDRQSSKLKKLIEDLVEASKASSGNLQVNLEKLDLNVFLAQTIGEWSERLEQERLTLVVTKTDEPVYIHADGRHLWRVVDNLLNNICKYAQPDSRVYISIEKNDGIRIVLKNISRYQLNISAEELLERFVRGDKSRNSSGHGLGLSIAQSLMNLMGGKLQLFVDGDLFKVVLSFQEV